jgi:2-keto-4-pentenoate hydratase
MRGGEKLGRKIGFTNRSIWPIYDVNQPIWATMTNETIENAGPNRALVSLSKFCEPRIEPEIVIGLHKTPPRQPSLKISLRALAGLLLALKLLTPFTQIGAFHWATLSLLLGYMENLVIGQKITPPKNLIERLKELGVILFLNSQIYERGQGSSVLEGPIYALQYLQHGIEQYETEADLKSGHIVTTGTLTDAKPISAGQIWSARFQGLEIMPLEVKFIK